ncbi:hypothetical protein [Methanoregula sp.]|uniref:hypothetical protein n=1 Tax=Methanoregula sp. TaxID=2052170 RepID=UPI0023746198|nr:hypothetical protein [Methanoregula sp.]MDD1686418.1 hypothetical protein [Methanoregula sp.]
MPGCPFCSSDKVYSLLDTMHCKRCKNIWKEEDPGLPAACDAGAPDNTVRIRKRTDPLETRLEKRLDECLKRSNGKFCLTIMNWQAGDISPELFRRYLMRCRKNRSLAETKDRYGRIWYSRIIS